MGKIEKKIAKLESRIRELENDMYTNLKQKTSNTAEISLSDYQRKIEHAKKELKELEGKL